MKDLNLHRPYGNIIADLKKIIKCPKWRSIFENNLTKVAGGYDWKFEKNTVFHNMTVNNQPSSLVNWNASIGLYPGRSFFVFP